MASAGTLRPKPASLALALAVSALGMLAAAQPATAGGFAQEVAALRQAGQLRQLTAGELRGPAGWTAWCALDPAGCTRADAAIVTLDAAAAATIQRVFALVHARITPEVESPGADRWRVVREPGPGDCEDYALTWRQELIAAGLPRGALDIAVVMTEQDEVHAVLVIQTDQGSLVLDNRHDRPLAWSRLPYAWLALEPTRPEAAGWQALPDIDVIGTTPTVTAEGRR